MDDRPATKPYERDLVGKYAPYACCMGFLLSALIMGAVLYLIFWLIKSLFWL